MTSHSKEGSIHSQDETLVETHTKPKQPTIPHFVVVKPMNYGRIKSVLRKLEKLKFPEHLSLENYQEINGRVEVICRNGDNADLLTSYIQ